jgi:hypothetical protein
MLITTFQAYIFSDNLESGQFIRVFYTNDYYCLHDLRPCSLLHRYWRSGGTCWLHLRGHSTTMKIGAAGSSDMSVTTPLEQWFSAFVRPRPGKFFFYKTRARYNWCQGPVVEKHFTRVHGVRSWKTVIFTVTAVRTLYRVLTYQPLHLTKQRKDYLGITALCRARGRSVGSPSVWELPALLRCFKACARAAKPFVIRYKPKNHLGVMSCSLIHVPTLPWKWRMNVLRNVGTYLPN